MVQKYLSAIIQCVCVQLCVRLQCLSWYYDLHGWPGVKSKLSIHTVLWILSSLEMLYVCDSSSIHAGACSLPPTQGIKHQVTNYPTQGLDSGSGPSCVGMLNTMKICLDRRKSFMVGLCGLGPSGMDVLSTMKICFDCRKGCVVRGLCGLGPGCMGMLNTSKICLAGRKICIVGLRGCPYQHKVLILTLSATLCLPPGGGAGLAEESKHMWESNGD